MAVGDRGRAFKVTVAHALILVMSHHGLLQRNLLRAKMMFAVVVLSMLLRALAVHNDGAPLPSAEDVLTRGVRAFASTRVSIALA